MSALQRDLRARQLDQVVPLYQLLRTASEWQRCHGQPFDVAPRAQWPALHRTLELLAQLRREGVLHDVEVVSAYRNDELNRCAGGAAHSAHTHSFAVDLLLPAGQGADEGLCRFWKSSGAQWQMGLSRYPSGRIHVDTSAYRTWGADFTRHTSFCR